MVQPRLPAPLPELYALRDLLNAELQVLSAALSGVDDPAEIATLQARLDALYARIAQVHADIQAAEAAAPGEPVEPPTGPVAVPTPTSEPPPTPTPPAPPATGGLLAPLYRYLQELWAGIVDDLGHEISSSQLGTLTVLRPIAGGVAGLWDFAHDELGPGIAGLRDQVANVSLLDIPKAISGAQEGIASVLGQGLGVLFRSEGALIGQVLGGAFTAFLDAIEGPLAVAMRPYMAMLRGVEGIPPELDSLFAEMENPTHQWTALALLSGLQNVVVSPLAALANASAAPYIWAVNRTWPRQLVGQDDLIPYLYRYPEDRDDVLYQFANLGVAPDKVDTLLKARVRPAFYLNVQDATKRRLITPEAGYNELRAQGYLHDWAQLIMDMRRQLLSRDEIQDAVNRGLMSPEEGLENFQFWGYNDADAQRELDLRFKFPGVQDVIRFGVREAYRDDIAAQYGTDEDFPEGILPDAARIGLPDPEVRKYWRAHWVLPSITEAFEMFHRTTAKSTDPNADTITLPGGRTVQNVIGLETLNTLLRVQDYMPAWRDKLIAIAYTPYTRIDIRRFYRQGVLDLSQVFQAYLDIGYDTTKAQAQADFVDDEGRTIQFNRALPEIRQQAKLGILDGQALLDRIAQFTPDLASAEEAFDLLELDIRGDRTGQLLTAYRESLHGKRITPANFATELATLGISPALIEHLARVESIRVTDFESANETSAARAAGRGVVVRRFREGLDDELAFTQEMLVLGYSQAETDRYLDVARLEFDTNYRLDLVDTALVSFRKGKSAQAELAASLDHIGIAPQLRDAYIEREIAKLKVEDPTASQVELRATGKGTVLSRYREGWTTPQQFASEMSVLGYSTREAQQHQLLADLSFDLDWKTDILATYRNQFKRERISGQQFLNNLASLGMDPDRAQTHLALAIAQMKEEPTPA